MSVNLIPARYRNRHRGKSGLQLQRELTQAEDRATSLTAALDQAIAELTELRAEKKALLNLKAAADDTFVIQVQLIDDLEDDVRRLRAELADEQGARAVAEADVEARNRWIKDLERERDDAIRCLDIRVLAESAAAETQEIDASEIRRHCITPVPLNQAPFATTNPGWVRPSWAVTDEGEAS